MDSPAAAEIWKPLPGFEDYYLISDHGNIKYQDKIRGHGRKLNRVYVPYTHTHGYKKINLRVNNKTYAKYMHRLVASAFIPNPDDKPEINHIDGKRDNNHVSNLEWCTRQENVTSTVLAGRVNPRKGEQSGQSKLTESQVINIRHCEGSISNAKLGKLYGVSGPTIDSILNRKAWKHI